tara:strand:+ start:6513 stop:7199 length:687 start_codon:yes stop_codon:yes gene_type:complete
MSHFNENDIKIILDKAKNSEIYIIIGFGSRVQYNNPEEIEEIVKQIFEEVGGFIGKNPVFIYNGDPSNDNSIGIAYAHLSKLMKEYNSGFLIMTQINDAKEWGVDKMMNVEEPVLYVPSSNNCAKQCKFGGIDFDNKPVANTKSITEINKLRIERNEKPISKVFVIGDKIYEDDVIPHVSVISHFEKKIFSELNIPIDNIFAEAKNKDILKLVQSEIFEIESQINSKN